MHVANLIRRARKAQNLTQKDVADKLGYDGPQYISNVERGLSGFSPKKGKLLCKILKISPIALKTAMGRDYMSHLNSQF